MYVDDPSIEAEIYLSSSELRLFSTKLSSSKYAKFILFTVCSWDDVAYGIYETADCISSASEYGCDVYTNALEKVYPNTISCEENILHVLGK